MPSRWRADRDRPPPRSIDQLAQLRVSLARFRPAIWRRVLLPAVATLGDLHVVIQVLSGWDGDHLHEFTVGKKRYADPSRRSRLNWRRNGPG